MILKLINWILHWFNYELVSFAEMERMKRIINGRTKCVKIPDKEVFHYDYFGEVFHVYAEAIEVRIEIKAFKVRDYGSEENARACAQELCDKLNERP